MAVNLFHNKIYILTLMSMLHIWIKISFGLLRKLSNMLMIR